MLRWAFKIGLLFVALALMVAVFLGHLMRTGPDLRSETVELAGLREPVEVLYDSMGVPHIFASSMEDLFFAQGYVHAKHRLWQMEMFRRVLQGRLSEIFGAQTLETDRFLRTIGMEKAAREGENVMPFLVECCKHYATVGEMADVFREVYGEYVEPSIF